MNQIRATKVVVQPWLGRHHVYGIFMVPDRYKENAKYTASMNVGTTHRFTATLGPRRQHIQGVSAAPGHYLLRSYVPTRTALWFLMTGRLRDLQACDWTLVFTHRSP